MEEWKKRQRGLVYRRQDGFREETQFEKVEVFIKKKNPTAVELNKWFLKKCCKKAQFHLVIS